jgi:hypothetical protein
MPPSRGHFGPVTIDGDTNPHGTDMRDFLSASSLFQSINDRIAQVPFAGIILH